MPSGGISFARKQNNQGQPLNAKKLDIDFGGDDFFNSFQPAAAEPENMFGSLGQPQKKSNKLQEVESGPIGFGGAASTDSKPNSTGFIAAPGNSMNEK